jgi:hypothetical protein
MKNPNDLTPATALSLAQARIRDPRHWCQRCLARDAADRLVSPTAPEAVRWCAAGALLTVTESRDGQSYYLEPHTESRDGQSYLEPHTEQYRAALHYLNKGAELLAGLGVTTVNDYHGHAATLRAFDLAITMAASKEPPGESPWDHPAIVYAKQLA